MNREARIIEALGEVPPSSRAVARKLLRVFIHDLNGAMATVTMEAFNVDMIATKACKTPTSSEEEQRGAMKNLHEAAQGLAHATRVVTDYLAQLESLSIERNDP